jgi:hypothetical protein
VHPLRLRLIDDQLPIAHDVAEGDGPTHPHALALGRSDLVADAFAGHLALELREGQQHVQCEPAHAGRRIEVLRD